MIIGISGKIGSGKDTVAGIIQELTNDRWEAKKYADKLKQVCHIVCGGDIRDQFSREGKAIYISSFGMTIGEIQQLVGTNAMRDNFDENVWVKALMNDYVPSKGGNVPNWIITDVRFPNEAAVIRKNGGYLLRLEGDPVDVRKNSDRDLSHPSETSLDDYRYWDGIIYNTGSMDDLKRYVENFLVDVENRYDMKFNWL